MKNAKEAERWKQLTPDMMSDEELQGDIYIRHPPSYRSDILSKFVAKLDSRAAKSKDSAHPRVMRRLGSPAEIAIPSNCKKWMVKAGLKKVPGEEETDVEDENENSTSSDSDRDQR